MRELLSLDNPRGYGQPGSDTDSTEHGKICTAHDIDMLCRHTGAIQEVVSLPNGIHNLIRLNAPNAKHTVVLIAGGSHELYCMDSAIYPEGFIMPANTLDKWMQHNINVVLVSQPYPMPWGMLASLSARFTKNMADKLLFYKKAETDPDKIYITRFLKFVEDMHRLVEMLSVDTKVWLAGHCSSAEMIVQYCNTTQTQKPHGIVLWSPVWLSKKQNPQLTQYFLSDINIPVIAVQHKDDSCQHTGVELSEFVIAGCPSDKKKLVILEGGIDQGCPCFSMGHHGYRGIEDRLVKETADFINEH